MNPNLAFSDDATNTAVRDQLRSAYEKYLGREPDQPGLEANLRNPGGLSGALDVIRNSPEAEDFRNRPVPPAPPPSAPPPPGPAPFGEVPGFNLGKLQDPTHVNAKYTPDVRLFSQALAGTGAAPNEAGLQTVADWINAHGGKASRTGADLLSFNGGPGIDVIRDVGGPGAGWWFNNQPGQSGSDQGGQPFIDSIGGPGQPSDTVGATDRGGHYSGFDFGPMNSGTADLVQNSRALIQQLMGGDNNAFLRMLLGEQQGIR